MEISGLSVCRYDYHPGWKLVSHRHDDFYQVFFILEGTGLAWLEHEPIEISDGGVLLITPGTAHGLRPTGKHPLRTVDAKFQVLTQDLAALCRSIPRLLYPREPEVLSILGEVRDEAEARAPLFREVCELKLNELLLRLARGQLQQAFSPEPVWRSVIPIPRLPHPIVDRLIENFQIHYGERVCADSLSRALAYSYRHISEATRHSFGMTPMRLLMHYRIDAAQKQILEGQHPLKDIAYRCGFSTVHHFSRVFTSLVGISPGQWRDRLQGNVCKHFAIDPNFEDHDRTLR